MQEASYRIYNASAGSGKTFTLVKQYLKIVLSSHSYKGFQQILAITFTNKAVNEMKQRILDSLFLFGNIEDLEHAPDMFMDISKELHLAPPTLRQRAKRTLKEILHNYAFFDVSTIDKFTHRLIRTFAKDLKLSQNFEVALDTDLLLEEAVASLISKVGKDNQMTDVLLNFALAKIDDDKSWDIAYDLNKIGKLLFNENHSAHLKILANKSIADFLGLKQLVLDKKKKLQHKAIEQARTAETLIQEYGLNASDFPRQTLPNHFKKISEGLLDPAKLYNNKLEQSLLEGTIVKSGVVSPSTDFTSKIQMLFLALKGLIYEISFLENVHGNIIPLTVLNSIQKELNTISQDRNLLPISSFNTLISNEIKDQPAPFIYERLGEKYRHYFIDEFQDTSEMQWNNLIPLIGNALESENEQGKRGSLLLVGDVKQAIYRWRGGKAEQLLNLINSETNPFVVSPTTYNLPSNYRSYDEIITFNNGFFTATSPFLGSAIYSSLFKQGNMQKTNHKKGGLVQLLFVEEEAEKNEDEQYCNSVLSILNEVLEKSYNFKDICILTRKRKHGVILADFLMQHNIPVISSETLLLQGSPKVAFLINLLRHTIQPEDVEIIYDILYFLAIETDHRHVFIKKNIDNLNTLLWQEYGFDLDYLKHSSPYDGLEYSIKQFRLAQDSDAYLTFLLDVVLEVEQKEGTGVSQFLSYWERKKEVLGITANEKTNAIHIMTVHKAKGLEFPIVLFPYANSNIYEEIEPKLWLPVPQETFKGFKEVLINKKKEVIHYNQPAKDIFDAEQHNLELDAFNLLYVALTRAVNGLYIITKKDLTAQKEPKTNYYSGIFIKYLIGNGQWEDHKLKYTFGSLDEKVMDRALHHKQETILYRYSSKDRPSFNILTTSGILWGSDREEAIYKGNVIHFLMELIFTIHDVDHAMETLIRSGDIADNEIGPLRAKILGIINHPKLISYYKEGNLVKNETDIITENGVILRPDRIVINKNMATIIDYKTGKESLAHKGQLLAYAEALENMGYVVAHKIIVYIGDQITPRFI
ncbi:UvrD-helicase domain-containing protein [Spongiimicrobium sp. 3-5]|uniref:UvrD-helicase domain-containing protein n=1 Tax=Spongiimicrobium sp. 3-5 TaxID=3332596 RepID=UPI00397EB018